ncbi:MAG: hypothetical protein Q9177_000588 [Variospora cf. flavescens]
MSVLFYKRPDYVPKLPGPMSLTQSEIIAEKTHMSRTPIPAKLSFENIVQNKAQTPCTLQDFLEYLVYVSHDAENLQFWLWLQDYTKRFYADSPAERSLSPPWSTAGTFQRTRDVPHQPPKSADKSRFGASGYNFDQQELSTTPRFDKPSFIAGTANTQRSWAHSAEDADGQAELKRQACRLLTLPDIDLWDQDPKLTSPAANQPHRYEIDRIISHYLSSDSPRELNLSPQTRAAVLDALQHTTHPSGFSPACDIVESILRAHSYPNFIRWSLRNVNEPRARFIRRISVAHVVLAVLMAFFLALSNEARGWRLWCFPLLLIGLPVAIAAHKGICFFTHSSQSRNLRPWEQFSDAAAFVKSVDNDDDDDDAYSMTDRGGNKNALLDPFGPSNSYDHELWVEAYRRKKWSQKVFSTRNVRVRDETLRSIQKGIVMQSWLWGALIGVPFMVLVLALPKAGVLEKHDYYW